MHHHRQRLIVADDSLRQSMILRSLSETAITAVAVLQSGNVGVGKTTGGLVRRSLTELRAIA